MDVSLFPSFSFNLFLSLIEHPDLQLSGLEEIVENTTLQNQIR